MTDESSAYPCDLKEIHPFSDEATSGEEDAMTSCTLCTPVTRNIRLVQQRVRRSLPCHKGQRLHGGS